MKSRVIIIFLFSIFMICIQFEYLNAQQNVVGKEYSLRQVYDSNGNPTDNFGAPSKLAISILNMYRNTLMLYLYNDIIALYSPHSDYNYRGTNNGWYIYEQDLGIGGKNFVYVKNDFSFVRVCESFYDGKFVEYRPFVEGEDINMTPTR